MKSVKIPRRVLTCPKIWYSPLAEIVGRDAFVNDLEEATWNDLGNGLYEYVQPNETIGIEFVIQLGIKSDVVQGIHSFKRVIGGEPPPDEVWNDINLLDKLLTHLSSNMITSFAEVFKRSRWSKLAIPYGKTGSYYSTTSVQEGCLTIITIGVLYGQRIEEFSKTVR